MFSKEEQAIINKISALLFKDPYKDD